MKHLIASNQCPQSNFQAVDGFLKIDGLLVEQIWRNGGQPYRVVYKRAKMDGGQELIWQRDLHLRAGSENDQNNLIQ